MPNTDCEGFQVLIKDLQKPVNFGRASPETTPLAMQLVEILNSCNQRLRGDRRRSIKCLLFLGGECVNVSFDCKGKCWVLWLSDDDRNWADCRGTNGDRRCTGGRGKCTNRRRKCADATTLLSDHAILHRGG